MLDLNKITCQTAENYLNSLPDNSIDLIVTSPPYDDLRDYNGFKWDFEIIAKESYRVLKEGGVLVWVIGDKYTKGSKGLASKKQAIHFVDNVGFRLHDEIVWLKGGVVAPQNPVIRYGQSYENCFVFSKSKPKTLNIERYKNCDSEKTKTKFVRKKNGELKRYNRNKYVPQPIQNVWKIYNGFNSTKDKIAYQHPAMFPEELARRHILSWSNEGDVVLDYFMGSGTTAKMALLNNRNYLGCDISQEYVDLANERLKLHEKIDTRD